VPTSPRLARRRHPPQHRRQHLPLQLATPTLVTELTTALTTHHLPTHLLRVEITEGTAVTDLARAIGKLHQLTDAGIAVELDDYGTATPPSACSATLPLTTVKIDKTFIDTIDTNPTDTLLVQGVITTAKALGLTVIAEGVLPGPTSRLQPTPASAGNRLLATRLPVSFRGRRGRVRCSSRRPPANVGPGRPPNRGRCPRQGPR